jgi:hypothetical protein
VLRIILNNKIYPQFTDKDVNEILEMQSKSYEVMLVPLKNAFYPIEAKHSISNEVSDQNNARIFDDNEEVNII